MDTINPESDLPDEALIPGVYRTRDSIANLRLKIKIRRVETTPSSSSGSSTSVKDAASSSEKGSGSSESVRSGGGSSAGEDSSSEQYLDEVVFGWQDKVFNTSEYRYYSGKRESDFDSDVLRKKFFHDVQSMSKAKAEGQKAVGSKARRMSTKTMHRIYTTLDGELVKQGNEEHGDELLTPYAPLTTNPVEEPNHLSELMSDGLRRRRSLANAAASRGQRNLQASHGGAALRGGPSDATTIPKANLVLREMTRDTQLRLHALTTYSQTMVIRFDTSESEDVRRLKEGQQYEDYVDLAVMRLSENGVLEVTPDFTYNHMKPYRIEVSRKDEPVHIYEYWLEHISPSMAPDVQLKEALMLNDVYARHLESRMRDVGEDFETPPSKMFRMVANVEIVSAENFDYDNLFIHYFVDLPVGWAATKASQLTGITQTCKTAADPQSRHEVAYYSYVFSVDLLFDMNRFDLEQESLPKWPQLFFEVISVDSWTRSRTEGYGFVSFPFSAGSYDLKIDSWRPVRGCPLDEMRRYFIGGTPELDDLTYAGTPREAANNKVLSRYGFRTVSSGSVRFRMNIMHQSKAFLGEGGKQFKRQFLMDRLSSASLFSSVSTVLSAFQKARDRFQRVSEGYEVNLLKADEDKVMEKENNNKNEGEKLYKN